LKIGLEDLPRWKDFSSYEDFLLITCKARSNSSELDRDSTQFYTCEEHCSSSFLITASYHDLIDFAKLLMQVVL
jgi:hypothetical protein